MDNAGREALLHLLTTRDIGSFNVRKVPQTAALGKQKAFSRTGLDRVIEKCAAEGILPCAHFKQPNIAITSGEGEGRGFYLAARKIAPDLVHVGSPRINRQLQDEWGCKTWHQKEMRGIEFPRLKELRGLFDKKHGAQEWDTTLEEWEAPYDERPCDRGLPF